MHNPAIHAFFLGRALAEVLGEKLEDAFTNALSDLGKFEAEQRENLRLFVEEVQTRADLARERGIYSDSDPNAPDASAAPEDLQFVIDELRAEIARARAELKNFRNQSV